MVKWAYCRIKCGFDMKYKFSLDKGHFITGMPLNKVITACAREFSCFVWGMMTGNIY